MAEPGESRLEPARRRSEAAKRALTVGAATAFVAALVLARVSHPGHASSVSSGTSANSGGEPAATDDGEFDFGSGAIAPSGGGTPQVQTSVS